LAKSSNNNPQFSLCCENGKSFVAKSSCNTIRAGSSFN
jgi:hypothetical protein